MRTDELFGKAKENVQLQVRHGMTVKPLDQKARKRIFTVLAVVGALERLVVTLGSVSQVARHLGVSRTYLSMVLSGHRTPSKELARVLGYQPTLFYVRTPGKMEDASE